MQLPQGGFQVAAGRLLERRNADIGDAEVGIDDLHVFQAGNFDMLATDVQDTRAVPRRVGGHLHPAPLGAGEHRSGFVGGKLGGTLAVDRHDAIFGENARPLRRAARNHMDDQQRPVSALSSTPRPTKLPSICS